MTHEAESATIWRALVKEFDKGERAQKERDRRNRLAFSLDDERLQDYLESRCMAYDVDPCRIFIRMESYRILYDALNSLLGKQAVRIYRYFFCEENYSQIARSEGVDESTVRRSIERGLIQLRKSCLELVFPQTISLFVPTPAMSSTFTQRKKQRTGKAKHLPS